MKHFHIRRTTCPHLLGAIALISISALNLVSGCTQAAPPNAIDQASLCEVSQWQHSEVAAKCRPGQKTVFLPNSFGNEQLPAIFAAVNCDLRYQVVQTTGAVTCIYSPVSPTPEPSAAVPAKP